MSYNGSGTFNINSTGQPVVAGTVITASAFNALTTDLATGLTTAITKDGQTTTTARITFAQGVTSSLVTDSSSVSTGSIITAGGAGIAKNLYVGGIASFSAQPIFTSLTASSAVATDASKGLVSVTNTGTGNNVLATSPTLVTPILGTPQSGTLTSCTGLPNAGLVNSSITIGGTAIALGASSSTITNDLSISGLTVGKGGAGGAANTAFGNTAIPIAPNSGVTAIGNHAGAVFNTSSDTGQSTFVGYYAGAQVSTGTDNTFVGGSAGTNTTTGAKNTAIGSQALTANTTASNNTAVGYQAGYSSQTMSNTTAVGYKAGYANTGDNELVAVGYQALTASTTGTNNTALGHNTLASNTTGSHNLAVGSAALNVNTTGSYNTALGRVALVANTTGSNNTAIGYNAGSANTTNSNNTYIGYTCGSSHTGAGCIFIGPNAFSGYNGSNQVVFKTGDGREALYADIGGGGSFRQYSNSATWAVVSDQRVKENIVEITNGLEKIVALRPVTFDYITSKEHNAGFIAQDFQTVLPDQVKLVKARPEEAELVGEDEIYSIQQNLVPYLVKAIQELKAEFDAYKATHP